MRKTILYLFASVLCIAFSSCEGLSHKEIVGKYFLVSMDGDKYQTSLSQEVGGDEQFFAGIIDDMVYSVGFDNRYIIAKQHPRSSLLKGKPDLKVTYYYIVDMIQKAGAVAGDVKIYGPYDEGEFYKKRKELGISDSVEFSINMD